MSTTKVFVGSLPPGCKPEELRHLFLNYGVVVECDIMNRCGFVHLESAEMADSAIAALNGTDFKGQQIVVEPGRPKDRKGPGGAGNRGSDINRRQMQGHGGNSKNGPPTGGGNFNRGGGHNFRGGGADGKRAHNFSNGNNFGPMRNDGNNRQQRNTPYGRGSPQQGADGPSQSFKSKFNQGSGGGGKFGIGGNNFNNSPGGRFGGNANNQFSNWDNNAGSSAPSGNSSNGPGGRRNIKNSPSGGFSGNPNNNDFHSANSSGGGYGNQRGGGGGPGSSNHSGQDRRGFALPAVEHQQQQQLPYGAQHGRFGNGPILPNTNNADNGMFQRHRNNPGMNSGNSPGRGGFNAGRGGFVGRGGFNARRGGSGGAPNNERNMPQHQRGGFNNGNHHNAYHTEFPPLGNQGGGPDNRNRNNGPRQNMAGGRRY